MKGPVRPGPGTVTRMMRCCSLFRDARAKAGGSRYLWERLRGLFPGFHVPDRETLYQAIAFGHHRPDRVPFDPS